LHADRFGRLDAAASGPQHPGFVRPVCTSSVVVDGPTSLCSTVRMPDLSPQTVDQLEDILREWLGSRGAVVKRLGVGGSAAVFLVSISGQERAIKVYDRSFFAGQSALADKRRLNVQRSLIGHDCDALVAIYEITEALGTAFVVMEYLDWPPLTKVLGNISASAVSPLINQLVDAVCFLEDRGIVHRDVKPENIHVSKDLQFLKLLDLGIAREMVATAEDESATDHGEQRPFISTAQYSSPEYLFRLDHPDETLWRGLNLYQVGAVLYDLIEGRPLFDAEKKVGNRYAIARAVLQKQPILSNDNRALWDARALCLKCLAKDVYARIGSVSWSDFRKLGTASDPRARLKARLATAREVAQPRPSIATARMTACHSLIEPLRAELLSVCGADAPLICDEEPDGGGASFEFEVPSGIARIRLQLAWGDGIEVNTAKVMLSTSQLGEPKFIGELSLGSMSESLLSALVDAMLVQLAEMLDNGKEAQ
jgi:eukaryotic-like serine/threonine-protein kinase